MPRISKADMLGECYKLYRKLVFISTANDPLFIPFYDVDDNSRMETIRVTYERYMAVKDDIVAMEQCLRKQINRRVNGMVKELCADYHVRRPASIQFTIHPTDKAINGGRGL